MQLSGLDRPRQKKKSKSKQRKLCKLFSFLKEALLRRSPSMCLEPWQDSHCTESTEPHGPQSGMLALNKTHRLGCPIMALH